MTKTELISAIAEEAECTLADAAKLVEAFTTTVANELKAGGKVAITGFGTFSVSDRAARKGRNPQTGAEITIAASKAPKFKAGAVLKGNVQ
jgi:DNA-binding protein HU-beta